MMKLLLEPSSMGTPLEQSIARFQELFSPSILLASLLFLASLFYIWKHHPSYGSNVGPVTFPLVGCLPSIIRNKHRLYDWSSEVLNSTPTLTARVVLGTSLGIATANPANLEHILKTKFESYPKGECFYPYFSDLLGTGIFNADGDTWKFQRKVASHEFTTNSLRDFVMEVAGVEIQDRLLPDLFTACDEGRPLDLQALLLCFTLDTISQLTLGADPACLGTSEATGEPGHSAKEFAKAFDVATTLTAERFLTPLWLWKLKKALNIGNEKRLQDSMNVVNEFARSFINKRKREMLCGRDSERERKDLLSRFMGLTKSRIGYSLEDNEGAWKATEDKQGQTLSDSFLRDILLSFLLAGRDTVASGLVFFIWLLSRHPRVEKAVYEEVTGILRAREGEQDSKEESTKQGSITFDDLRKMNYLHAALTESMRLYPPTPSDCKYAMEDDTLPDGTQVQKGYRVSYNVFAMGRARRVWGDDCCEFKPERWLKEDGQFLQESPYKYPVFQAGPRICVGKDFAYIQMKLVVASLIREFEFKVSPEHKLEYTFGITLKMANGLPVTVKRRRRESHL